jgi:hypothetical protein
MKLGSFFLIRASQVFLYKRGTRNTITEEEDYTDDAESDDYYEGEGD